MECLTFCQLLEREFAQYNAERFRQDLLAGLTVAAVALPLTALAAEQRHTCPYCEPEPEHEAEAVMKPAGLLQRPTGVRAGMPAVLWQMGAKP